MQDIIALFFFEQELVFLIQNPTQYIDKYNRRKGGHANLTFVAHPFRSHL